MKTVTSFAEHVETGGGRGSRWPWVPLRSGWDRGGRRPDWVRSRMRVLTLSVFASQGGQPSPLEQTVPGAASCARVRRPSGELASNRCPRSSRIRPANDRGTSRNDGNGWSIESAGQEPDSGIAAGSEIGPGNTLKVETRVEMPASRRHAATALPGKLFADMSLKKSAQRSRTPQSLYGRVSNAGPARDTCRRDPNRKPSNRPLTCGFSRGAGRT
jgi:hypothetical protein